MFDFGVGYSELFVLAIIAVIVVGPKDLPVVLRKFGQIMQKVRGMAREFQGHVDVAMKEAGVADLKSDLQAMKSSVNSTMSMPAMQVGQTNASSPKKNDFDKFFGDAPTAGETSVAGHVATTDAAAKV
jgi:sec-independent protein translocase protein TatB